MQHCSFLPAFQRKLQKPCPSRGDVSWSVTVRWPVPTAGHLSVLPAPRPFSARCSLRPCLEQEIGDTLVTGDLHCTATCLYSTSLRPWSCRLCNSRPAIARLTNCHRSEGARTAPAAGAARGTGHPFLLGSSRRPLPAPSSEKTSSGNTARPAPRPYQSIPSREERELPMPRAGVATPQDFAARLERQCDLYTALRFPRGSTGANAYTQPRIRIVPDDNLRQTGQAHADPDRNQAGFPQTTVFLNGRLCSSGSSTPSDSAFLPRCSNFGRQRSLLLTLFG